MGERLVLGVFRAVECREGRIVLVVNTADTTMRFAEAQFSDIDFISYRADAPRNVACGPQAALMPVVATYRPLPRNAADGLDGDAVAVELIPDGFRSPVGALSPPGASTAM